MKIIGKIETDMPDKFGVPRQSRLVNELCGRIVFEKEYRIKEMVSGLENFSHLWILWEFSENKDQWSPTVRPPRLGGDTRKGVFATRSPFRPNPIGMSCVKIERIDMQDKQAPIIYVSGVDMVSGTPIYDIKPYVSYTDCVVDAKCSFADEYKDYSLDVNFPENLIIKIPEEKRTAALGILAQDPRPGYQNSSQRIYGVKFMNYDIHFKVEDNLLTVVDVVSL